MSQTKPVVTAKAAFVRWLPMVALGICASVAAQQQPTPQAERERLANERVQIEKTYAETKRECETRFIVTSCVEDAQVKRREGLARVRGEQLVLDQAERKQRAAARVDSVEKKVDEAALPAAAPASAEVASPRKPTSPEVRLRRHEAAPKPQVSPQVEAEHRAAYERRQAEAKAHREDVERHLAERAASGKKPSRPLPLPDAAVAASAASR